MALENEPYSTGVGRRAKMLATFTHSPSVVLRLTIPDMNSVAGIIKALRNQSLKS